VKESFKRLSKNHEFYKESEDNSELNGRLFVMMRAIWRKFYKNDIALRFEF
jgi:hypothetical protein